MLDNRLIIIYNVKVSIDSNKYGLMVKRLRHRPFTAESGVRFPLRLPKKLYESLSKNQAFFIIKYLWGESNPWVRLGSLKIIIFVMKYDLFWQLHKHRFPLPLQVNLHIC